MRSISITQFLTPDEIEKAWRIWKIALVGEFARRCEAEVIRPVIERINKQLGQENDPRYLAYMVEYTFMEVQSKAK